MAYIYRLNFDISPDQMNQLEIGAPLERIIGYLRTLMPNQPGFIEARALRSIDLPDRTNLSIETSWISWEELEAHRKSNLSEEKILAEFEPHVKIENLGIHIYEEVR